MKSKRSFLVSALYLAGINIFLRGVALSFNAYVSGKIGTESMGLFTLVMSVYGLVLTISTSGVNLAAVRLTAECHALIQKADSDEKIYRSVSIKVIARCVTYSLMFSIPTSFVLYFAAQFIAEHLLCDIRCLLSLRVLSLSLVPISLTSTFSGFFTGIRKVYKNAVASISEQAVKIIITSGALSLSMTFFTDKVEYYCLAVVGGAAISEGFSLVLYLIMFLCDSKRPNDTVIKKGQGTVPKVTLNNVFKVAFPVALGAYVRQGFSTAEHLAIPGGLRRSGLGSKGALEIYGVLQGMVFPLILFPSSVLLSATGLLVPELAESNATGDADRIRRITERAFKATCIFSVGCTGVLFVFSEYIGLSVYSSPDAAHYIRLTAPLIPIMYFDMCVDSILKGIGEQFHSMVINIIDSALSFCLALILVPAFGIQGYLVSVYVCEGLNCFLSILRLKKVTGVSFYPLKNLVNPTVCSLLSLFVSTGWNLAFRDSGESALRMVIAVLLYLSLTVIFEKSVKNKKRFQDNVENSHAG